MALGAVKRRCSCTNEHGKLLGSACPRLRRTAHGYWYWRIELPADTDGTRRPRRRSGFTSRTDAQAELDQVRELLAIPDEGDTRAQSRVGDLIVNALTNKQRVPEVEEVRRLLRAQVPLLQHPTVGDYLTKWLAGRKTLARNTHRSYESHIRLYLTRYLGELRLDKIRVEHITDMFDMIVEYNDEISRARASNDPARREAVRYQRPVKATSMQRIRATLRKALNDAIRQELITFNPAQWVELPPENRPHALVWTPQRVARWKDTGTTPSPVMVWTPAQTGAFLDHAVHDRLYPLFHLVAHCGLRRGEACGLRWIDTDLDAATIDVLNQLVQHGWETDHTRPKTEESMATVALDPATVTVLEQHRVRQRAERHAANKTRPGSWKESGLVFTQPDGSSLHPADVTAHFQDLSRQAGLPPVRLHDLRHGAATLALAAGVDIKVVQSMLRHADVTTTSNLYTSVLPEVAHTAARDIAKIIPRATEASSGDLVSRPCQI